VRHRFEDDRGEVVRVFGHRRAERLGVVERHDDRILDCRLQHPRGLRVALAEAVRGRMDARVHVVVPAVIAALELEDRLVAGVRPRQPDGVIGRLAPRVAEVHPLHRRHEIDEALRYLDLALGRPRAVEHPRVDGSLRRGVHRRVAVPEEYRAKGEMVVGELVAVRGRERRAVRALERHVREVVHVAAQPSLRAAWDDRLRPRDEFAAPLAVRR